MVVWSKNTVLEDKVKEKFVPLVPRLSKHRRELHANDMDGRRVGGGAAEVEQ